MNLIGWLIILSLASFIFYPASIQAQIVINEVFPAPTEGKEWIELYNLSEQKIELSNWFLEDQLSSPSTIFTFTDQTISAQAFLTIELTTTKLNNSADGVILKNPTQSIVDQMSYSNSKNDYSWSKNNQGSWLLTSPTKNSFNIFPSPSLSPSPTPLPTATMTPLDPSLYDLVLISEFLACPKTGEKEWVKLLNTGSTPLLINNWKIRDASNQTREINTTLGANEDQLFSWSGSLLNNDGDSFSLEDEHGKVIQKVSYDSCQQDTPQLTADLDSPPVSTAISFAIASPPTATSPAKTDILVPPSPPATIYRPQQLTIKPDLLTPPKTNQISQFSTQKLPKIALLSVILGGSLLLISGSWSSYVKISHLKSPSSTI